MIKRFAKKVMEKISFGKIVSLVIEAEKMYENFKGKAGEQKKEYVVTTITAFLPRHKFSFITKPLEEVLVSVIIDVICYMFNTVRGKVPADLEEIS